MKRFYSFLGFLFLASFLFSQTITLTDGKKSKTIEPDDFLEVVLGMDEGDCKYECGGIKLTGSIIDAGQDTLVMKLTSYTSFTTKNDINIVSQIRSTNFSNTKNFLVRDLYSLKVYKSEKSKNRIRKISNTGAALFASGLLTALTPFLVSNSDDRRKLFTAAGAQVGLGVALGAFSHKKRYFFKQKGKKKLWKIQ